MKLRVYSYKFAVVLTIFMALVAFSLNPIFEIHGGVAAAEAGKVALCDSNAGSLYTISFEEKGLEAGVTWHASIGPVNANLSDYNVYTSSTSEIQFTASPGAYSASYWADGYYANPPYSDQLTIGDKSYTINVTFYQMFPVNITATGIPANLSWGFNLKGSLFTDIYNAQSGYEIRGNTITAYAINGTYRVLAGEEVYADMQIYGNAGNITVSGAPVNMTVNFSSVNLSVHGIPDDVSWGFCGDNAFMLTNGSMYMPEGLYPGGARNVSLYLPIGSAFLQPVAKGYYTPGINISVSAANISVTVVFDKEYPVTFWAENLTYNSVPWQISGIPYTFEGIPGNDNQLTQTYWLPNGTYNITAVTEFSYYTVMINGTYYSATATPELKNQLLTVNGASQSINVTFHVTYAKESHVSRTISLILFFLTILGTLGTIVAVSFIIEYTRKK